MSVAALARDFAAAGIDGPERDARLLAGLACGLDGARLTLEAKRVLTDAESARLDGFRARRLAREPVSRIAGQREFWGLSFLIDAATLDPRPDSETVVEAALAILRAEGLTDAPIRLLDVGTGSGCLLIALLSELPRAAGVGVDASEDALRVARENAARLGLSARARFIRSDWLRGVEGSFCLIVSNPPYVESAAIPRLAPEVRDHDPIASLDGGPDGLEAYRRIAPQLRQVAPPGAWAVFECGAGQAERVRAMLDAAGFPSSPPVESPIRDLAGVERVVAGKRQPPVDSPAV
jgi:release factor glutamine methyltransferase